jgi:hypothetical protein
VTNVRSSFRLRDCRRAGADAFSGRVKRALVDRYRHVRAGEDSRPVCAVPAHTATLHQLRRSSEKQPGPVRPDLTSSGRDGDTRGAPTAMRG